MQKIQGLSNNNLSRRGGSSLGGSILGLIEYYFNNKFCKTYLINDDANAIITC